ncbi:EAL domain-containing protein [Rhodoferax sp. GW822-FHT02A01]|uniref:putative bifunctional diguanylate cyclase/phosphodiesterase n=1 Tax=Rhodoferax sp. GW822-FHT02A01 TaxID=3141537 RepID=UPI00315D1668
MKRNTGGSLRHQVYWRLFSAFVLVALFGGVALLLAYQMLLQRTAQAAVEESVQYVKHSITQLKGNWQKNALEVKSQIDFMRIFGKSNEGSWLKLQAYFSRLEGQVGRFPSGVVTSSQGKVLFAFGPDGEDFGKQIDGNAHIPVWYYSAQRRTAFALIQAPLWLGDLGNGQIVFLQALDSSVLATLAPQDVRLLLVLNNRTIGSSRGSVDDDVAVNMGFSGTVSYDAMDAEQRPLQWFDNDLAAPQLLVQYAVREPLSRQLIFCSALALLALFTVVLWVAIGRWSTRVTRRIEYLSQATAQFAGSRHMSEPLKRLLHQAGSRPDEIARVAQSAHDLMQSIETFDHEQFAYLQTLEILEEGVVELDNQGVYLRASPGWSRLIGREVVTRSDTIFDALHPEEAPDFHKQLDQLFTGEKSSLVGRIRLHQGDKKELWVEYRFITGDEKGKLPTSVRGVLRDITQSYLLEKHISHMALHDALTELPNRILFEDRAAVALRTAQRKGTKVAVGFVDLDHFKNVNDQHGHKVGDQMLVALAQTLRASLRAGDTLARWGGDEFVVLLTDLSSAQDGREVMAKFAASCERPIQIDGNQFNVTCSMGVAIFPDDAETTEAMLSQADRAMFFAKEQGRNTIRFVSDIADRDQERRSLYIQNMLAKAIKQHKLQVWFQPIVDASTRRTIGCEALARWHDETYGWVSPATFIPMAENLGLIREVGQQVWAKTVENMSRWKRLGMELRMAVNVSRRQLFIPSFTTDLLDDLTRLDLSPSVIDLEITESVAMEDAEHTTKRLAELTACGFGIAIDDFGTGYSSLSQLHDMPATKVKIDISFVRRVHIPQGAQLIQAIVKIASAFNLQTVAEGVEDERTAAALHALGVNALQGYHFARPMAPEHFEEFLLQQR